MLAASGWRLSPLDWPRRDRVRAQDPQQAADPPHSTTFNWHSGTIWGRTFRASRRDLKLV